LGNEGFAGMPVTYRKVADAIAAANLLAPELVSVEKIHEQLVYSIPIQFDDITTAMIAEDIYRLQLPAAPEDNHDE